MGDASDARRRWSRRRAQAGEEIVSLGIKYSTDRLVKKQAQTAAASRRKFDVLEYKLAEKDEFMVIEDGSDADLCLCALPWDFSYTHKLNIQAAV